MSTWTNKVTTGDLIQLFVIVFAAIWFAAVIQGEIAMANKDLEEIKRQVVNEIPSTYARKDVIETELRTLREQLDRIESKLDN